MIYVNSGKTLKITGVGAEKPAIDAGWDGVANSKTGVRLFRVMHTLDPGLAAGGAAAAGLGAAARKGTKPRAAPPKGPKAAAGSPGLERRQTRPGIRSKTISRRACCSRLSRWKQPRTRWCAMPRRVSRRPSTRQLASTPCAGRARVSSIMSISSPRCTSSSSAPSREHSSRRALCD